VTPRVTVERIEQAAGRIDPVFLHSPQFECEPLSAALGVRLVLKVETLNPIRCFKGRGADWLVAQASNGSALVCASAGNFGQAMAYACRRRGIPLTVYAATTANPLKVARMHDLVGEGSQFVVATHSPVLLAYPGALIYELAPEGFVNVSTGETHAVVW